jgi:hypothetical protein
MRVHRPFRPIGILTIPLLALLGACGPTAPAPKPASEAPMPAPPFDAAKAVASYQRVPLTADMTRLTPAEREVLRLLVRAAGHIDAIFWRQAYSGNAELRPRLAQATDPAGRQLYEYFLINYGPFDRLRHDAPFVGRAPKPEGANFYPPDLTRQEFDDWLARHPGDADAFRSSFTVIRRQGDRLTAVPYSREYRHELESAAELLRQAAARCENRSLKRYLELRARDLLTDDFFDSDTAWMDVSGTPIEAVIGPYEVYEDKLLGYKASYEAYVTVVNADETRQLAMYKQHLPDLERRLPLPAEYRQARRGQDSPIRVVDEIYVAGDGGAGVQTSAFNLPNDERVRQAKGSKKVLLKNVMQAKFDVALRPIAAAVLAPEQAARLDFDAFFDHVLFHEISHGMGPGALTIAGRATTVSAELRDLYPALEEAKADTLGLWCLLQLMEQGVIEARTDRLYPTYVAGLFRAVRFGIAEAHGLGTMVQYNYLARQGAVHFDRKTGRFQFDAARMRPAVDALARELLLLEATADYDTARAFLRTYGEMPPEVRTALDGLRDVPTDIRPIFPAIPE